MRRAARVDRNQPEIVKGLRRAGATVQHLHTVGSGCPDILVGFNGQNFLLEIKDGKASASRQRLTPDESDWHDMWRGDVDIVRDLDEALYVIGVSYEG